MSDSIAATPMPASHVEVAPMMAWTTAHQRYFMRQITRRALLYTEMVTTGALLYGPRERALAINPIEHPVALQLGGSDPAAMAECASLAESAGFDEINLNIGCPSERVQHNAFGACLMAEPDTVAACVEAMQARVHVPVTVKTRIGIDNQDDYSFLWTFADAVHGAGAERLIVHARKAWLSGLSPKENRTKPPLDYPRIRRLAADFPGWPINLNGGLGDLDMAAAESHGLHGVMLGRAAYQTPYIMADVDRRFFQAPNPASDRSTIALAMRDYAARQTAAGTPIGDITRHILGLYHGCPGGRRWRRILSEGAQTQNTNAGPELIDEALEAVEGRTPAETRRTCADEPCVGSPLYQSDVSDRPHHSAKPA
ncbi:tRNA dihydrouridine(20/20a) synthase DusA [Salinisphaera sp. USBA-960]|uniref:tRNA dihydrouridine(20/20a) synthase DusA n=1 Tax=Salinisphaera orenii TaxID=856731 RepID=UPI000DBEA3BD|nr:tRNA dihydrouridine(20/20a) synthase DusA [Salifodinibacter halophilus]NNC25863.1 tRNA dihydrouridine(20/20a) synthase DusA [Salifodinibacter halophilus]